MSYSENLWSEEKVPINIEKALEPLERWSETWDSALRETKDQLMREQIEKKDTEIEFLKERIRLYHDIIVGLQCDRGF